MANAANCSPRLLLIRSFSDERNRRDRGAEGILERHRRLTEIISEEPGIQLGSYVGDIGKELFGATKAKGMEGIVANRTNRKRDRSHETSGLSARH